MTGSKQRTFSLILLSAVTAAAITACGGGGTSPAAAAGDTAAMPATSASIASSAPTSSSPAASATSATSATNASSVGGTATASAAADATAGNCDMFPASAIFNTRIDDTTRFPALANSAAWVSLVGASTTMTANWGASSNPADVNNYWGMPINTIAPGGMTWPVVSFDGGYPDKSDCATSADGSQVTQGCGSVPAANRRFPFPASNTLVEGNGNSDHHVLVVDRGACRLWEAYGAQQNGGQWSVISTATWDLHSNALRPDGWGSADAAGLPIAPLLVKQSEAATGEIHHALRVTFRDSALSLQHVWPARFAAGADNPGAIPFGSLLRLKANFVIPDNWSPQAKAVALAAQRYGMYVADNGADFYVQGEPNTAWDASVWQQLATITMADMEFVDTGAITKDSRFNADSMQASW